MRNKFFEVQQHLTRKAGKYEIGHVAFEWNLGQNSFYMLDSPPLKIKWLSPDYSVKYNNFIWNKNEVNQMFDAQIFGIFNLSDLSQFQYWELHDQSVTLTCWLKWVFWTLSLNSMSQSVWRKCCISLLGTQTDDQRAASNWRKRNACFKISKANQVLQSIATKYFFHWEWERVLE